MKKSNGSVRVLKAVASLALLTVGGCVASSAEIYVDSRFTTEERIAIQAAGDAWERATDGAAHATFVWDYVLGSSNGGQQYMVRQTVPVKDGLSGYTGWTGTGEEHIYIDVLDPAYPKIIAHELGHHFTHCGTHLAPGNLMAPGVQFNQADAPTPADVAYFGGLCPSS